MGCCTCCSRICFTCKTEIPELERCLAYICLISNILIPGLGTFFCSFMGDRFRPYQLFVSLWQTALSFFIIGWIWSIYWGCLIFNKAEKEFKPVGDNEYSEGASLTVNQPGREQRMSQMSQGEPLNSEMSQQSEFNPNSINNC